MQPTAPSPLAAGTTQDLLVTGLSPGTTYYFRIRVRVEVTNQWSALSNLTSAYALQDTLLPGGVTNLTALTGTDSGEVTLRWTAPGDDSTTGTLASYVVKYSTFDLETEPLFSAASSYVQAWLPVVRQTRCVL